MDDDFYDIVIDIENFEDLKNKGWKIEMNEKGKNKYKYFKDDSNNNYEEKLLNRIGILGGGNVGKTFILHKLLGKQYNDKIKTRGISVIYPEIEEKDKLFVCLDTCNTLNTSLFAKNLSNEEVFNLSDKERSKYMKDLIKDKIFRNIFIEDFIIEKANILIFVLDQLTIKEQKFLFRLKNNNYFDKIFVIHNLQFFSDIISIEEYIENTIKKSMFSNLEKRFITYFDDDKEKKEKPYYFYEKEFGNMEKYKLKQEIIHLFMAKEHSPAGNFFNDETIKYITYLIRAQWNRKIFNIIEEIKEFLSLNSILYMIRKDNQYRPILEKDLYIEANEDGECLKCKKDFYLKKCIINEMGNSNFSLINSIKTPYICYKGIFRKYKKQVNKNAPKEIAEEWPALIIKTEMFVNPFEIKVIPTINDDYESMILTITCPKKIKREENIKEIEFLNGDIVEGEIQIDIKINLEDILLDPKTYFIIRETNTGILLIYLKIMERNKVESFKKEVISKKKIKIKKK